MRREAALGGSLAALAALVAACSGGPDPSVCPPEGTTLTYATFGRSFLATHCVRCHGGAETLGSIALTTHGAVRERREQIFAAAASESATMPPGPDGPSLEDRRALANWLSCGAP